MRIRYSLRLFLLTLTVTAIWLGVVGVPTIRQRALIQEVERLNGRIIFSYENVNGKPSTRRLGANPPGPLWLRQLIGDDFFVTVSAVFLDGTDVTDEDLKVLENSTSIKLISLNDTQITGDGLKYLAGQRDLQFVSLRNCNIDDVGITHLCRVKSIQELRLNGTQVNPKQMDVIATLPGLQALSVSYKWIGEKETESLRQQLPGIEIFYDPR